MDLQRLKLLLQVGSAPFGFVMTQNAHAYTCCLLQVVEISSEPLEPHKKRGSRDSGPVILRACQHGPKKACQIDCAHQNDS